jgi:hypothetical protein
MWFSAFASLATAQLGEDPKGDPKFADPNTGVDEDSGFAPKEKGFAAEEPLATPKENPLLGAAPKDPNAKVLVVEEVDGAPNEKVEEGGLGPRFAEAPNPDPKREGTGEGWAATSSEKPPKAWLLVPCTAMAGVLDAPVDVGRVVKLLDPNAELVVVPNTEIGPLNASKWFGVLPEARGEGAIVVLVAGFERAVVGTAKPKGKGAGAAEPTVNTEAEELMPWPMEGVAKSACDRVELELAAEELPDINPPAPNNVEVEEIGDIVVNPKATPADRAPDILLEMDVFLISWSNIFFWDSSAWGECVEGEVIWDEGTEGAPNWKGDFFCCDTEEEPNVNGDKVAAVAAKLLVPEMLQLVPVWETVAEVDGTEADLVLLKPKTWKLVLGVTDEFMSKANLLLGFEIACCSEVGVHPAEVPKLVDVAFPGSDRVLALEKFVVKKLGDVVAREARGKGESGASCPIVGRLLLLAVTSVDSTESTGDSWIASDRGVDAVVATAGLKTRSGLLSNLKFLRLNGSLSSADSTTPDGNEKTSFPAIGSEENLKAGPPLLAAAVGNAFGVEGASKDAPDWVDEGKVKPPGLPALELIGFQDVTYRFVSTLAGAPITGGIMVDIDLGVIISENTAWETGLTMELVLVVEIVDTCKPVYAAWFSSSDPDSWKAALIRKPLLLVTIGPTAGAVSSSSLQLANVSLADPVIVREPSSVWPVIFFS